MEKTSTAEQDHGRVHYPYPDRDPYTLPPHPGEHTHLQRRLRHTLRAMVFATAPVVVPLFVVLRWTGTKSLPQLYGELRALTQALATEHATHVPDYAFLIMVALLVGSALLAFVLYNGSRQQPVYLVEFATWQPYKHWQMTRDWFAERVNRPAIYTPESVDFMQKIMYRSGLGDETAWHPTQLAGNENLMASSRDESATILGDIVAELLTKTGIKPTQIDILVVNCSLFNPTPSTASMIINKFKMRPDICSYNLAGMGCSAGVLAIDLARELLQTHKNSYAIVLSTETLSTNFYNGNDKSRLVQNCIFRCGGAGILLTNRHNVSAKYVLTTTVRVCTAADDAGYNAIFEGQDEAGVKGVSLVSAKPLLSAVGDALRKNLTILGPKVLPYGELLKYAAVQAARSVLGKKRVAAYTPNFKKAFQHFCIHAGGKAVIDGMEQNLGLTPQDVEPSRATLYRMGNTSSSSIWYELFYIENARGVKKGDQVWQLAFGAGIKCNSAVWKALRNIPKMDR